MIVEDDLDILVDRATFHRIIDSFFSQFGSDYHVLLLGSVPYVAERISVDCEFVLCLKARSAACYIANIRCYEELSTVFNEGADRILGRKILQSIQRLSETGQHWNYAIDVVWDPLMQNKKWFYPVKMVCTQTDGTLSDNSGKIQKYSDDSKRFYEKCNTDSLQDYIIKNNITPATDCL